MTLHPFVIVLALLSLLLLGCGGSGVRLTPAEVPQLARTEVRMQDGRTVKVPEQWTGKIVQRNVGRAWRLMTPERGAVVRAAPIPAWDVDRLRRAGWTDAPIEFKSPFHGGLVPAPAPGARYGLLWVRDTRGRTVEIPVETIEYVEVSIGPSYTGGIVVGITLGVLALGALTVLLVSSAPIYGAN